MLKANELPWPQPCNGALKTQDGVTSYDAWQQFMTQQQQKLILTSSKDHPANINVGLMINQVINKW